MLSWEEQSKIEDFCLGLFDEITLYDREIKKELGDDYWFEWNSKTNINLKYNYEIDCYDCIAYPSPVYSAHQITPDTGSLSIFTYAI